MNPKKSIRPRALSAKDLLKVKVEDFREKFNPKQSLSYKQFIERKIEAIGVGILKGTTEAQNLAERVKGQAERVNSIPWAELDASRRAEAIRRLIQSRLDDVLGSLPDLRDPSRPNRVTNDHGPVDRKPKKKKNVKKRDRPQGMRPSPKPKDPLKPPKKTVFDSPGLPSLQPPVKEPVWSVRVPKESTKRAFTSRVGYFVSISDMYYYTESDTTFDEKRIELEFEDRGGKLDLKAGERWVSPYYETRTVRGIDLSVYGTHRINAVRNPDFEI